LATLGMVVTLAASVLMASGCSTGHPQPLSATALETAQTFPYYPIYWAGARFDAYPLTAVDGMKGYLSTIGDSVYYGDCVHKAGVLDGGSCVLPLQVTTVIYRLHSNAALGPQRNTVLRGVPAVIYDKGRSIELYSGRVAIDVFSASLPQALQAAAQLRPLNVPGFTVGRLPAPVYCPGLSGAQPHNVRTVMAHLPHHACQAAAAANALTKHLAQ
jgi:hypothetical protein